MVKLLNAFFITNTVFWFCASLGGALFLIQLLLMVIGLEGDHTHSALEAGRFGWLLKQKLTGFLMMFGLSALACKYQFFLSNTLAYTIGIFSGSVAAFVIGWIFQIAARLQSSGATFHISQALEKDGIVYQRIPQNSVGKISISVYNLTYELDAVAEDSKEIPSFTSVRVIKIKDEKTVVVKPFSNQ
jgi:hypothetical protein